MPVNESRFLSLFIIDFHAFPQQLNSEYQRIIGDYGNADDIKIEFFKTVFTQLIEQFKREFPKDQNYKPSIVMLYDKYISELEYQFINADEAKKDRQFFMRSTSGSSKFAGTTNQRMPQHKQYNLNTKYGRGKARQQAQETYNALSPSDKTKNNLYAFLILLVICFIMWLLLGTQGFIKWSNH